MRKQLSGYFLILLAAAFCFGQTQTARLQGIVHDASGAVVPSAKVVATNDQTKETSDATSNPSGLYVLPVLRPGIYTLRWKLRDSPRSIVKGIELAVSANVAQDVTLEVGKLAGDHRSRRQHGCGGDHGRRPDLPAVTMNDINMLPQSGRQPISLTYFQPAWPISPERHNAGADYSYSHVNGLRQGSNNNTLDGIDVNDAVAPRLGLAMTANNSDSVEEFREVTAAGKAEYGRNAGGQVELITRSGTNEYHGKPV